MQFENGDVLYIEKDGERLRFEVASYSYRVADGIKLYDFVTVKPCDAIERLSPGSIAIRTRPFEPDPFSKTSRACALEHGLPDEMVG